MDPRELARRIELNYEEFLDLFELFVRSTPAELAGLSAGVKEGNLREVIAAAHTIKGSAVALGLDEAYELARQIEALARYGSLEDAPVLVHLLKGELGRLEGIRDEALALSGMPESRVIA